MIVAALRTTAPLPEKEMYPILNGSSPRTRAVNVEGAFRGDLINAENIGKTSDDLVVQWDEEHPDRVQGPRILHPFGPLP